MTRKLLYFWDCFWSDYHFRRIDFNKEGKCPHERKWFKHEVREGNYNAHAQREFVEADGCLNPEQEK
jgi:hypothetical protein